MDKNVINKIRSGYYSALYFNRTKEILFRENNVKRVTMQIFQKNYAILCGIDEVIELLKIGVGYFSENKWINKYSSLNIEYLSDGGKISPRESVLHITGPYQYFVHLESLYLGILARRTLIATNSNKIVCAASGKPIIFFGDRYDYFLNQEGDGYAAHIGGINTVCTDAQAFLWKGKTAGTIPHSLIAINDGNTLESIRLFNKHIDDRVIALVDFNNDCISTSLDVAKLLKNKLWGVRVDTAEDMKDKSLNKKIGKKYYGVNSTLIKLLRRELDMNGFPYVKIIVSGGFNTEKVIDFEKKQTPVDMYGVGSSLLKGNGDFTADIVKVEEKKIAKSGRHFKSNKRFI